MVRTLPKPYAQCDWESERIISRLQGEINILVRADQVTAAVAVAPHSQHANRNSGAVWVVLQSTESRAANRFHRSSTARAQKLMQQQQEEGTEYLLPKQPQRQRNTVPSARDGLAAQV